MALEWAIPAKAEVLRASTRPNIRYNVSSAYEAMTAIKAADDGAIATALDTELKALAHEGEDLFPDGTDTTEAQVLAAVNVRDFVGDLFVSVVMRYMWASITVAEGVGG